MLLRSLALGQCRLMIYWMMSLVSVLSIRTSRYVFFSPQTSLFQLNFWALEVTFLICLHRVCQKRVELFTFMSQKTDPETWRIQTDHRGKCQQQERVCTSCWEWRRERLLTNWKEPTGVTISFSSALQELINKMLFSLVNCAVLTIAQFFLNLF